MARSKIIKEWVDVFVTSNNQIFKANFEVDKHAALITGFAITSNADNMMYYRGSQRIVTNDMELYPEDYESKMLMQGLNVSVNDRIIKIEENILPGNRQIQIEYKDTDHPSANFTPYRVRLYVYSKLSD